jgi:hypothetical protein
VTPFGHRRGRTIAGLQHQRVQAALKQVRGRRKSLRARTNDDDGIHTNLHALMFFDMKSLPDSSTSVNMWGRMGAWLFFP